MKTYEIPAQRFGDKEVVNMASYIEASREEIRMLRALLQTQHTFFAPHLPKDILDVFSDFIEGEIKPLGRSIDNLYRKSIGEAPKTL